MDSEPTVGPAGLETTWRGRARTGVILALIVWAAVTGALAWFLANSQSDSRRSIVQRTQARVQLGAEFATLYVGDLLSREHTQGMTWLGGRQVTKGLFERTSRGLGLSAAVLLDSRGRLLQVVPADPSLLGQPLSRRYAHLAAAVAGHTAVSNVVPSAARADPVVGLATPFQTSSGRRVFSGAYDVSHTPLGAYLTDMTAIPGHRVYLVDARGQVISSTRGPGPKPTLALAEPALAVAVQHAAQGSYESHGVNSYFLSARVHGTPWRIVMAVPEAQLFNSVDGPAEWLPWVAVAGLVAAGLALTLLLTKLQGSRIQMRHLNTELDRLAHTDALTGVRNRRAIKKALEESLSATRRHRHPISVLMIDLDHFKHLNDTLGHYGGDGVLIDTTRVLAGSLRTEDLIGRWGGEEFLVVLPFTDEPGAERVAERLREAVATLIPDHPAEDAQVTITVGVADWAGETSDLLIAKADAALYAGKVAGRNVVQTSSALQRSNGNGAVSLSS